MTSKKWANKSRGLAAYTEFTDINGNRVWVQDSSLATKRCARIYTKGADGKECVYATGQWYAVSPHLTEAQVRRLIKGLQRFLDAGE